MAKLRADEENIPVYSIRLRNAYLHEAKVSRRGPLKRRLKAPTLKTGVEEWGIDAEASTLIVVIAADVKVPFRSGEAELTLHVAVAGEFAMPEGLEEEQTGEFANREAVVILYPYLRSHVGELARMTGLQVPVLPTLDVNQFLALAAPDV